MSKEQGGIESVFLGGARTLTAHSEVNGNTSVGQWYEDSALPCESFSLVLPADAERRHEVRVRGWLRRCSARRRYRVRGPVLRTTRTNAAIRRLFVQLSRKGCRERIAIRHTKFTKNKTLAVERETGQG